MAASGLPAQGARAQTEQLDAITRIDGQSLTTDAADVYFNAEQCAAAATTRYDLTLIMGAGVSQAYLWAGTEQAGCEQVSNRTDQTELCREVSGNPQTVGDNATMFDLTLQNLVDTGVVDCENTSLQGQPYWLYSFRNDNPGGNDVPVTGYGIAPFIVDVTPPQQLSITSEAVQEGSSFNITWNTPTDSQFIAQYKLYTNTIDDPETATFDGITANQNATGISVSAAQLGLAEGDDIYLFVSAVDFAAVNIGDGNEGPLSVSTRGVSQATGGFCDDPEVDCSGCSVSPLMLPNGQPSAGLWIIGIIFAIVVSWRFRR